jgi:serine/threonine protein kinase
MAEIYLARPLALRGDGRIVVVKRVLPQVADDPNFIQMFRTETRVCVGFNHPNIVQMYDFGQVDRQPYIAMEYVEGRNLQDLISRFIKQGKTLPLNVALTIIARAADALHYAHSFRNRVTGEKICIVHRDVSPQNILVSYDGKVKLIDFGIAKPGGERGEQTRMGTIKGKIAYLSPEQVRCEPLDGRSDLFSLAIVLWELLAGKRLFNPAGSNDFTVIQTIANCDKHIKPPSHYNPEVPSDLDAIVMKALRAEKNERYGSAEQFQADLRKFIVEGLPGSSFEQISETMVQTFHEEMMRGREYVVQLDQAAQHFLEHMHDLPAGTVAMPTSLIHAPAMALNPSPASASPALGALPVEPTEITTPPQAPSEPALPQRPLGFGGGPTAPGDMTRSGKTSMTRLMAARVQVPGQVTPPQPPRLPQPPAVAQPAAPVPPQHLTPAPAVAQAPSHFVPHQTPYPTNAVAPSIPSMVGPASFGSYLQPPPGYGGTRTSALGTGSPYYATGTAARMHHPLASPSVNAGNSGDLSLNMTPPNGTKKPSGGFFSHVTRLRVLGVILYFSTIWFIKADQEYLFFERFLLPATAVRAAALSTSRTSAARFRLAQMAPPAQMMGPQQPRPVMPQVLASASEVTQDPVQVVTQAPTQVVRAPTVNLGTQVASAEPGPGGIAGPPAYIPPNAAEGAPTDPAQARLHSDSAPARGAVPASVAKTVQLKINIQPKVTNVPTRIYVNHEQVNLPDGVITIPLDQLVSIRVERPLFYSYENSFVLNSRDLKPGGRFDLDIKLRVFQ